MRYLLTLLVLLSACFSPEPKLRYDIACSEEESDELASWILKCVEKANPQSDEEPEDWIRQCERTGKRTLCSTVPVISHRGCAGCQWESTACSVIKDPQLKALCPE